MEDSPAEASADLQEEAGKMKKVIALIIALTLLLTGCKRSGTYEASYGAGRRLSTPWNSW